MEAMGIECFKNQRVVTEWNAGNKPRIIRNQEVSTGFRGKETKAPLEEHDFNGIMGTE